MRQVYPQEWQDHTSQKSKSLLFLDTCKQGRLMFTSEAVCPTIPPFFILTSSLSAYIKAPSRVDNKPFV